MSIFQTEFRIKPSIRLGEFEDIVIEWMSNMRHSTIGTQAQGIAASLDDWECKGAGDERAWFKRVGTPQDFIAGVRHEIADDDQRVWRTEVVCRVGEGKGAVGVRVQCLATDLSVRPMSPKRPYITKMFLRDAWPASDGRFQLADVPLYARETDVDLLADAILGRIALPHPVVYVSRDDANRLPLDPEKLAFELGGVAHVVVEPSRAMSFRLMQRTEDRNPYGGTIGISVANAGCIRRFYIGGNLSDSQQLEGAVSSFSKQVVSSQKFELGCDWQSLQEAQTRKARADLDAKADQQVAAFIQAFDEENHSLKDRIVILEAELKQLAGAGAISGDAPLGNFGGLRELYPGETRDRLRLGVEHLLADKRLECPRTRWMLHALIEQIPYSGGARALHEQIKAAGRDSSEMPARLGQILHSLGFSRRTDGKHTVHTPPDDLGGVESVTVPKTPGDHRSGMNQAGQLLRNLSLNDILGQRT